MRKSKIARIHIHHSDRTLRSNCATATRRRCHCTTAGLQPRRMTPHQAECATHTTEPNPCCATHQLQTRSSRASSQAASPRKSWTQPAERKPHGHLTPRRPQGDPLVTWTKKFDDRELDWNSLVPRNNYGGSGSTGPSGLAQRASAPLPRCTWRQHAWPQRLGAMRPSHHAQTVRCDHRAKPIVRGIQRHATQNIRHRTPSV